MLLDTKSCNIFLACHFNKSDLRSAASAEGIRIHQNFLLFRQFLSAPETNLGSRICRSGPITAPNDFETFFAPHHTRNHFNVFNTFIGGYCQQCSVVYMRIPSIVMIVLAVMPLWRF